MAFRVGCTSSELSEDIATLEDGDMVCHVGEELILPGFLMIQYVRLSRKSRAHYRVMHQLERQFGQNIKKGWIAAGLPDYTMPDIIG